MSEATTIRVAMAQLAPVWLDRQATLAKVSAAVIEAANDDARLVCFGEAFVPGYPFWVERTDGARFESPEQKRWYAEYQRQAVCIEDGHLDALCALASQHKIAIYLGIIERPQARSGHSLYASLVYIDAQGVIGSVHRKLMPTYDERLVWATGDGHGLRTHALGPFTVGGLNCWENWMPLARSALYAQGENLHVAVWPGNQRNTQDLTRFIARESRSYVVSVSGLMRKHDLPARFADDPLRLTIDATIADGGSCIAAPDGSWLVAPIIETEGVTIAELDFSRVMEERQNFDPSGHYSRPDVTALHVNRERQSVAIFDDE